MLNNVTVQGRLVRDPEIKSTANGKHVVNFTVACDQDFDREKTDFIDVVAWNGTADFVSKFFHKGMMALITGRLQMRKWEDKDGNKRTAYEVCADTVYFGEAKRNYQ